MFSDKLIQNVTHSPDNAYPIETLQVELKRRVKTEIKKMLKN